MNKQYILSTKKEYFYTIYYNRVKERSTLRINYHVLAREHEIVAKRHDSNFKG